MGVWGRALALATAAACGSADTEAPIAFVEVVDDRVPEVAQTDTIGGHAFWGPAAAAGDVDGDGRSDLYLSGGGLYLNRPDPRGFRLERAAEQPMVDLDPLGAVFADADRDGDLDLTLCGSGGVRLLANDGEGRFSDITASAGVAGPATDVCVEPAWGDLDGDGYLDLAVATYGDPGDVDDAEPNHLYLNQRDGTFAELTDPVAGPAMARRSLTAAFADFDGDGRLDLYFGDDQFVDLPADLDRHDLVFLNRGVGATGQLELVEASAALGLDGFRATMGCAIGDPARTDGWDLFVADIFRGWLMHSAAPGAPFRDVSAARGDELRGPADEKWVMWGGQFADFDGDGYEELLVAQAPVLFGERNQELLGPILLRNRAGVFERVRYAFGAPMLARGTVLADLDGDGDDDVVLAPLFGRFRWFENRSPPRDYVRLELIGSASGSAGAVVTASADGATQKRMLVSGGRPFASGPAVVDLAFDGAPAADLTVRWPSGAVQQLAAVPTGATRTVSEPTWLTLSDPRPPADGTTRPVLTVDLRGAGLGDAGTPVSLRLLDGTTIETVAGDDGVARLGLPARTSAGPVQSTIEVDGRAVPAQPVFDFR